MQGRFECVLDEVWFISLSETLGILGCPMLLKLLVLFPGILLSSWLMILTVHALRLSSACTVY